MACIVQLVNVRTEADGKIYCDFSDGSQREFASFAQLKEAVAEADAQHSQCRTWLLAWWIRRDANGNNPSLAIGKTLTFDLSAANMLKVQ